MTLAALKDSIKLRFSYIFRILVHIHHDREYVSMQVDGAGEVNESSTSRSTGSRRRETLGRHGLLNHQSPLSVTQFLQ